METQAPEIVYVGVCYHLVATLLYDKLWIQAGLICGGPAAKSQVTAGAGWRITPGAAAVCLEGEACRTLEWIN